jgi:uncharacterized protein YndB with AHSA1/START domain
MAGVTRRRSISAPASEVWALVSDPYNLPRWWPRTIRVENVSQDGEGRPAQWTTVLGTSEGRGVRADYRCVSSTEGERCAWEQQLEGTPFARHLRGSTVQVSLAAQGEATDVSLSSTQVLRGLSRFGSPMMRRAQGAILEEALDGIERVFGGGAE